MRNWRSIAVADGQVFASSGRRYGSGGGVVRRVCDRASACWQAPLAPSPRQIPPTRPRARPPTPSTSEDDQSANESTDDDANTYIGDNDRTGGEETTAGGGEESAARTTHPSPTTPAPRDNRDGRTANKTPSKLPLAPPADLGPLPDELPPLPLEPPLPPTDLPPGDPDVVDVTMLGPGASPSEGNESPAMKLPAIIAPPAPPVHILGTSITARGTSRPALTSPARGPGEPPPLPRQPTTGLREPPITSAGVSFPGQTPNRIGLTKEGPRVRLHRDGRRGAAGNRRHHRDDRSRSLPWASPGHRG